MTQKLSPKIEEDNSGFHALDLAKPSTKSVEPVFRETDLIDLSNDFKKASVSIDSVKIEEFSLNQSFWDLIANDPLVQSEWKEQVNARSQELMKEVLGIEREKAKKAGYAEGVREGRADAVTQLDGFRKQLDTVVKEVLQQRTNLIQEHERKWIRAFNKVLQCFLLPKASLAVELISDWMRQTIGPLEEAGRIYITLSSHDYKALCPVIEEQGNSQWEVIEDPKLRDGEIRCECDRGGISFFKEEQLEKLNELVARYTKGEA